MSEETGMVQTAPYPQALAELVEQVSYRPGWSFVLGDVERDKDHEGNVVGKGLTLCIYTLGYDTYHPDKGETYRVVHYFPVPPATYDPRSWRRWLFECVLKVEQHECAEFFQVGDSRPYAPSHGPGNDPYMIREVGTALDQQTSFRGDIKAEDVLEAAQALAGGVASFIDSLPFMAPENVPVQAKVKLEEPLETFNEAQGSGAE